MSPMNNIYLLLTITIVGIILVGVMEQYKNWETNNESDALLQEMKMLSDNIRFEMVISKESSAARFPTWRNSKVTFTVS
jgi:hypothetical protein